MVGRREREGQGTYLGPWLEQEGGGAGRSREQARWRSGFTAAALLRLGRGRATVEAVVERWSGAGGPFKVVPASPAVVVAVFPASRPPPSSPPPRPSSSPSSPPPGHRRRPRIPNRRRRRLPHLPATAVVPASPAVVVAVFPASRPLPSSPPPRPPSSPSSPSPRRGCRLPHLPATTVVLATVWIAFDHVDGLKRLTVSGATVDGAVGVEGRWARRLPQRSNSEQ
ncbi:predicted GPI-anchored protein 58 [Panicum virgatum]|uniref:predicted GPI-anchored protein 58 n=1 Tax=Panicum virgatum TaxID=38727 RepID=UPI0019D678EF|nr:predicted GPI-anchored protein 58 [Panicum virgatum]